MATATLTLYKNSSTTLAFTLVSQSATGATYKVGGRSLSTPFVIELQRKLTAPGKKGNDHIIVRIARTERNTQTGDLATTQGMLDFSVPKDQSLMGLTEQLEILGLLVSALNDGAALAATSTNRSALISGSDL